MALVRKKVQFDHFRQQLGDNLRPIGHKEFEQMRTHVMAALETNQSILVQKARRTEHIEGILEVICMWTGIDTSMETIVDALKEVWPGKDLPEAQERHWIEDVDEWLVLSSASTAEGNRFVTARIMIRF